MRPIPTGYTVNQKILAQTSSFVPIGSPTFFNDVFQNGIEITGVTVTTSLVDGTTGAYLQSWIPNAVGDYQIYTQISSGATIYNSFMSEIFNVLSNQALSTNVYVGL